MLVSHPWKESAKSPGLVDGVSSAGEGVDARVELGRFVRVKAGVTDPTPGVGLGMKGAVGERMRGLGVIGITGAGAVEILITPHAIMETNKTARSKIRYICSST